MTRFLPAAAISALITLSSASFSAPAQAETTKSQPVTLTYQLENLSSVSGAYDVLNDLERQAKRVCKTVSPVLNTQTVDDYCVASVMAQAVAGINNDALTAAFEQAAGLALRVTDDGKARG